MIKLSDMILLLLLIFNIAKASEIGGSSKDVEINIANQSFESNKATKITYENITVSGKKIKRIEATNEIIAEDGITYKQGEYFISADELKLNLDDKIAVVKGGKTYINKFHLSAEKILAKFPDILKAKKARITTCSLDNPHYHIEADRVDFYPDSKFIAYRGWIKIGNFKLFPIPVYASYVTTKTSEDRAPLFPRVDYSDAKGTLVVYGFDYQVMKDKDIFGLKCNLDFLLNIELSQKRGLGVNRMRSKYNLDKHLRGEFVVSDWIQTVNETASQHKEGNSYVFEMKHNYTIEALRILALEVGKNLSKFEYSKTNSDLKKDSSGGYVTLPDKRQYSKTQIEINQEIRKIINLKYLYRSFSSSSDKSTSDVFKELIEDSENDAEDDVFANRNLYEVDTKLLNNLVISLNSDSLSGKFELIKNSDLRPEKGDGNKHKYEDKIALEGFFKPWKIDAKYSSYKQDNWSRRSDSLKEKNNYLSSEEESYLLSSKLGEYSLGILQISLTAKETLKKSKSFDPDSNLTLEEELATKETREIVNKRINEHFYSAGGKAILTFKINNDRTLVLSNETEYRMYINEKAYSPAYFLQNSIELQEEYNNSNVRDRYFDRSIKFKVPVNFDILLGEIPSDQTPPEINVSMKPSSELKLGNISNNLECFVTGLNKYHYENEAQKTVPRKLYLKNMKTGGTERLRIGNMDFFTCKLIYIQEYYGKGAMYNPEYAFGGYAFVIDSVFRNPSKNFNQKYLLNFDEVKVKFDHEQDRRISLDNSLIYVNRVDDKVSYFFGTEIFGVNIGYANLWNRAESLANTSTLKDITEQKITLGFNLKNELRTYTAKFSYLWPFDNLNQQYLDSTISLSLLYENRDEITIVPDEEEEEEERFRASFEDAYSEYEDKRDIIDTILEEEKPKKNIMDLGKSNKPDTIERKLKRFKIDFELTQDRNEHTSFSESYKSWKKLIITSFFKYGDYFEAEYKINKSRTTLSEYFTKDDREAKIKLGIGYKDYEWFPGFYIKDDMVNDKIEKIYGTLEHSMHCTKIALKLGKSRSAKDELVWMFGFDFSINDFPDKQLGMDIRSDKIESIKFGL